jgi:hypothetical protein
MTTTTAATTDRPSGPHPYAGRRETADGHIRRELRADGRYDEARGTVARAHTGACTVTGTPVDHLGDTGFTATGDVRDGVLYHEHLVLHRAGTGPKTG